MKKVILLSTVAVIGIIAILWVVVVKPHLSLNETRLSNAPETVHVVYFNITGDPNCAKLYITDANENGVPVVSAQPIFLALPNGLPSPEDGDFAVADNVFELVGFRYQWTKRTFITGRSKTFPSNRFDLVSWEVVPPYKLWIEKNAAGEIAQSGPIYTPQSHKFTGDYQDTVQFIKGNNIDCLVSEYR